MKRRHFIESTALLSMGVGVELFQNNSNAKSHILTLSFDDGFKKSFYRVAEIYEEYGLSACFNVIAMGHELGMVSNEYFWTEILGDFNDWNKLKGRGHEVMPHSWVHERLTKIPINHAKENLDKCLDYFEKNLSGYNSEEAIYNFAFNASNLELESYVLKRVRAVRTGGWLVMEDGVRSNMIPKDVIGLDRLGCWADGPSLCDDFIESEVNTFLASSGGWLILNLHGLDDEGWGPVSTQYLDALLKRLVNIPTLTILPAGEVLK